MLSLVPISLKAANSFVAEHHRHHKPTRGHKFSIGCEAEGQLVGVAIVGRPVSRYLDDGRTLEVNRLCTTGERNVCSMLYTAAARAAQIWGPRKAALWLCGERRSKGANAVFAVPRKAETELSGLCDDEGYRKIITYTLDSEPGTSLRAAGWTCMGLAGGKRWTGNRCPAVDPCPPQMKLRYEKLL